MDERRDAKNRDRIPDIEPIDNLTFISFALPTFTESVMERNGEEKDLDMYFVWN